MERPSSAPRPRIRRAPGSLESSPRGAHFAVSMCCMRVRDPAFLRGNHLFATSLAVSSAIATPLLTARSRMHVGPPPTTLLPVVLLIGRDVSMWTSSRSAPWPTRRPSRADDRASTSHWKLSALTARRQCARPAGKGVATLLVKAQEPAKFRPRTLDPTLALLSPPSTCVPSAPTSAPSAPCG